MKRKTMIARLKKGEDPLEVAIQKWQDIVDGKGEDNDSKNCALCYTAEDCEDCPVVTRGGGMSGCDGTPYVKYDPGDENAREMAKEELEFLKSLREGKKS